MKKENILLRIEDLSVGGSEVTIDRGISLDVASGEIVGIIGESGSGKSTLLKSILSLHEGDMGPVGGSIFWKGRDLSEFSGEELRRVSGKEISMVFQSLAAAFDPLTRIKDQYYEAVRSHDRSVGKREIYERAKALLGELRFEDPDRVLAAYPFELSGGMAQRAALAMALLNGPQLILADEVTSALDAVSQKQVVGILRGIREKYHTAILFVTHNMRMVETLADRVAVMYNGRIVECGPVREVLGSPAHPYTAALAAAVPRAGKGLPTGIEGSPPSFGKEMQGCPFYPRCGYADEECREGFPGQSYVSEDHYLYCRYPLQNGGQAR